MPSLPSPTSSAQMFYTGRAPYYSQPRGTPSDECKARAARLAQLEKGWRCRGLTGQGLSACMGGIATEYVKRYCIPWDLRDEVGYVLPDGKVMVGPGTRPPRGPATYCATSDYLYKQALRTVDAWKAANAPTRVRGLDGVKTIHNNTFRIAPYPYVPSWRPDEKDIGDELKRVSRNPRLQEYLYRAKVLESEDEDEKGSLQARAPEACGTKWFVIKDPELPPVSARAKGLSKGDHAYLTVAFPTTGSPKCEFIGKRPRYLEAVTDVAKNGVASPYFAFNPSWTGLSDIDVKVAKSSRENALMYFVAPTDKAKGLRNALVTAERQRMQAAAALAARAAEDRTGVSVAQGVERMSLLNKPYSAYPNMSVLQALAILKYTKYDYAKSKGVLCHMASAQIRADLAKKKLQAHNEGVLNDIVSLQCKWLREEGLLQPGDECEGAPPAESGQDGEQDGEQNGGQDPDSSGEDEEKGKVFGLSPLQFAAVAGVVGFVVYKAAKG